MSTQVLELRKILEERWPDAQPLRHATVAGVPTGIASLDRILPGGGLPRGRLSVWTPERRDAEEGLSVRSLPGLGAPGATAVLRSACQAAVARGERAAWVDGAGVVLGDAWPRGPILLRSTAPGAGAMDELEALVCAEELVRSGGFGMVVVTGVGRALVGEAVRLTRAAREGGSALVVVGGAVAAEAPVAALRLASWLLPDGIRWRPDPFGGPAEPASVRLRVEAMSLGLESRAEFTIPVVQHAFRLSMEPGLVDRRGTRK
ncbi:MAG TPA: hypothetical protein VF832_03280 [Longimicrobiales bacterium]